jgi:hypothetical protein
LRRGEWRNPIGTETVYDRMKESDAFGPGTDCEGVLSRKSHDQWDASTPPDGKAPSGSAQHDKGAFCHVRRFCSSGRNTVLSYAANLYRVCIQVGVTNP